MNSGDWESKYSGVIVDKEIEMHRLDESVWAVDAVRHTSEDTKELVQGWEFRSEQEALAFYNKMVEELQGLVE